MAEYLIRGETLTAIAEAIRAKTGKTEVIPVTDMPAEIAGITTGGGTSEDVRYASFVSYDGTEAYGKKAVAVGDDCADPITRGIFATPTRESTAQYNFTFIGWATEPNGALDENALKAVTEDRTLYAVYASVLRYYTITYYDDDGTTVLKTESLAYGATPAYTPEKDGFAFTGWTPTLATVTGNASYKSSWTSVITFANASWSQIAEMIEEGTATQNFKIGDTKILTLTFDDQTIDMPVKIADFEHDDLADGSGKATLSIVCDRAITTIEYGSTNNGYRWYGSIMRSLCVSGGAIDLALPDELRAIIKPVLKSSANGRDVMGYFTSGAEYITTDTLWLLSEEEVGGTGTMNSIAEGYSYPIFTDAESRIRKDMASTAVKYLLRSGYPTYSGSPCAVLANGSISYGGYASSKPAYEKAIVFGFCI